MKGARDYDEHDEKMGDWRNTGNILTGWGNRTGNYGSGASAAPTQNSQRNEAPSSCTAEVRTPSPCAASPLAACSSAPAAKTSPQGKQPRCCKNCRRCSNHSSSAWQHVTGVKGRAGKPARIKGVMNKKQPFPQKGQHSLVFFNYDKFISRNIFSLL